MHADLAAWAAVSYESAQHMIWFISMLALQIKALFISASAWHQQQVWSIMFSNATREGMVNCFFNSPSPARVPPLPAGHSAITLNQHAARLASFHDCFLSGRGDHFCV